jgi:hypothetical protein
MAGGGNMGIYVNPGKDNFEVAVRSQIYVDKTGLLEYTNSVLSTRITAKVLMRRTGGGTQDEPVCRERLGADQRAAVCGSTAGL